MSTIKTILTCLCLMIAISSTSFPQAKGWRGIVPLHSTCADVKLLLGVTTCEASTYHLKDETVTIMFSEKPCLEGWNVPSGTVLTIDAHPKPGLKLADLHIDESTYKKVADQHLGGIVYYKNEEEGISITVLSDGSIGAFFYGPTASDNYLRYPHSLADQPATGGDPHSILKFDEYGDLAVNKEHERLGDFALQLRNEPKSLGYIIAYAGRRAHPGEAKTRVGRAKNYIVTKRGIKNGRIVTVDGGYREQLTVELFLGAKGGAAPIPSPTVCESDVQIISGGTVRNKRGAAGHRK